ncbi:MAG TPA: hypothetical protein VGC15_24620 [Acetobacteraceae bacterium]
MPILSAASPVEIMARADSLGLPDHAREAALALFHALTSREELAAMDVPEAAAGSEPGSHDGSRWPAHGFMFGSLAELAPVLAALRRNPGAAELGNGVAGPAPGLLFLTGQQDGFAGVLVAGADMQGLTDAVPELAALDA